VVHHLHLHLIGGRPMQHKIKNAIHQSSSYTINLSIF
jgi:hypothetical protein